MGASRVTRVGAVVALAGLFLAGCGSSGSDEPDPTTTTEAEGTSTTIAASTTGVSTTATPTTTAATPTTTDPSVDPVTGLKPGEPCTLDEDGPDCIDPDGDGNGVYLIAGNDCMASAPDPALCVDRDGDGFAGYPGS